MHEKSSLEDTVDIRDFLLVETDLIVDDSDVLHQPQMVEGCTHGRETQIECIPREVIILVHIQTVPSIRDDIIQESSVWKCFTADPQKNKSSNRGRRKKNLRESVYGPRMMSTYGSNCEGLMSSLMNRTS